MTINRRHLAAAAILAVAISGTSASAQSSDVKGVEQAIEDLNQAMLTADRAKLADLLSDQLSYGHSAGRLETKKEFMDIVADKKTIYKTISLSDATVSVAGNNAIARHVLSVDTEAGGKPATAKVGVLQVWTKQDAKWKLLARQAFRLG